MQWTPESIRCTFQLPPPRQLDTALLQDSLNVVVPKIVRVVFYVVPLLMLVILGTVLTFLIQNSDMEGEWRLSNGPAVASGRVLDMEVRKGSKGSITYVYTFEFKPPGQDVPVKGTCFSGDQVASTGQEVTIEYLPDTPRTSRIVGCRLNFTPLETMVLLPIVGIIAGILPWGMLWYKKQSLRRLLVNGVPVMAIIERINPGAKGSLIVELKYALNDAEVKSKTNITGRKDIKTWLTSLLEAGQPVMILADPGKPKRVFLLELLTHKVSLFGLVG